MKHQPLCLPLRDAADVVADRFYWFTIGACFGLAVANCVLMVLR